MRKLIDVDRPPLRLALPITSKIQDGYYNQVDVVEIIDVVKIIEDDMLNDGKNEYFLSDGIDKPGIKPIFWIRTISTSSVVTGYVTDGQDIWQVVGASVLQGTPTMMSYSGLSHFAYKVVGCCWGMNQDGMKRINRAIKHYAEKL